MSRKRIRLSYCIALSLIAILTLAGYFILTQTIEANKRHAEIINIAGKQRMFSQRTALILSQLADGSATPTYRKQLDDMLTNMSQANLALGKEAQTYVESFPELMDLYYGSHNLLSQVNRFISEVRDTVNAVSAMNDIDRNAIRTLVHTSKDDLLESLDQAVTLHQRHAQQDSDTLKQIEHIIVIIAFSILILEGLLIFWPLERQILASQKEAEAQRQHSIKANHAKSEFLSNMSHEMRTPLNGIIGMAQMLNKTTLDNRQQKYVDLLESSAENMLLLVNDVLDYAKIEAGELRLEPRELNLKDNIADAVHLLHPLAQEKELALSFKYNSDLPLTVTGDGGRLRQIWLNLVGNAIKFTQEGRISVNVQGHVRDNIFHAEIDITDTGIGIADENHEKIFGKFSQADSSTTRKYGGTGLGLAISRTLARKMQGDITLTSKLQEGSSFLVTLQLPLAE